MLVGKKEYTVAALDQKQETFVVYVASFSSIPLDVRSYISGLIVNKALIKIFDKYVDFADIFSSDLVSKLFKHTGINNYAIQLVDGQQPPYKPIYYKELVELETLKAYIKTNLANRFIRPSKSPAGAPILYKQKSNSFF